MPAALDGSVYPIAVGAGFPPSTMTLTTTTMPYWCPKCGWRMDLPAGDWHPLTCDTCGAMMDLYEDTDSGASTTRARMPFSPACRPAWLDQP